MDTFVRAESRQGGVKFRRVVPYKTDDGGVIFSAAAAYARREGVQAWGPATRTGCGRRRAFATP
jgi:hypothetical protein